MVMRHAATGFTGKERDAETGLDYFGARYFSAAQGRFTSPDAPLIDQDPADPQSWNLYSYVRNSPLIFTDPTGRCKQGADGKYRDSDEGPCVAPGGTSVTVTEKAPKERDHAAEMQAEMARMQYEAWKRNQERNQPKEDQLLSEEARQTLALAYGRTAHDLGCVGLGALITGGGGAASAPIIPKPFSAGGTSNTSLVSTVLGGGNIGARIKTPLGMPGTSSFAWRYSPNLGRIVGRYLPYIGAAVGAASTYACLGSNP
jgi:RHS repeat-associated protein